MRNRSRRCTTTWQKSRKKRLTIRILPDIHTTPPMTTISEEQSLWSCVTKQRQIRWQSIQGVQSRLYLNVVDYVGTLQPLKGFDFDFLGGRGRFPLPVVFSYASFFSFFSFSGAGPAYAWS